jgi:hypothetical protein
MVKLCGLGGSIMSLVRELRYSRLNSSHAECTSNDNYEGIFRLSATECIWQNTIIIILVIRINVQKAVQQWSAKKLKVRNTITYLTYSSSSFCWHACNVTIKELISFLSRKFESQPNVITRDHSFPRAAKFRAEPQNLPSAAELTHFREISRKMTKWRCPTEQQHTTAVVRRCTWCQTTF